MKATGICRPQFVEDYEERLRAIVVANNLLAKAAPLCKYGENYRRDIAASASRLRDVIESGHNAKMIIHFGEDLSTRISVHGK